MIRERWQVSCLRWDIDARSRGEAVYRVQTPTKTLDFVVFSREPQRTGRSPRIIGSHWDMMAALIEGPVTPSQVAQTRTELPKLYAGRAAPGTLVWARANRSSRVFDAAVTALAEESELALAATAESCYLMRNTGLDGNGTFGTRTFLAYEEDHPLRVPYHAQMLCAYLAREFGFDLVEHLARERRPAAGRLDPEHKRYLGLGNGSALGLVLWVHNHPRIVSQWLGLREAALAQAFELEIAHHDARLLQLRSALDGARTFFAEDQVEYGRLVPSRDICAGLGVVADVLCELIDHGTIGNAVCSSTPIGGLVHHLSSNVSMDVLEVVNSLAIDLVAEAADEMVEFAVSPEFLVSDPSMSVGELRSILHEQMDWALQFDLTPRSEHRYVWYKSRNAEEPRRGDLAEVPPGTVDLAVDLPRECQRVDVMLSDFADTDPTAKLVAQHPEAHMIVERLQALRDLSLHTPTANLRSESFHPVHLIRLVNAAFYGLDKTKDYLGRNLRGLMFHGAPTRDDINQGIGDDWHWPTLPTESPTSQCDDGRIA